MESLRGGTMTLFDEWTSRRCPCATCTPSNIYGRPVWVPECPRCGMQMGQCDGAKNHERPCGLTIDVTPLPGIYQRDLTAEEMDADVVTVGPKE